MLLLNHYSNKFAKEYDKPELRFSDKALETFKNYNWPGNIRELENLIHQLMVMNENEIIDVPDLPSLMRFSINSKIDVSKTLFEVEKDYIRNVLISVKGNKSQAAKILGIDRKTLREKLKDNSE